MQKYKYPASFYVLHIIFPCIYKNSIYIDNQMWDIETLHNVA